MNYLFIMPHLDDETFSCGGILNELKRDNNVQVITVCHGRVGQAATNLLRKAAYIKNTENTKTYNLGYYDLELNTIDIPIIADKIFEIINETDNFNTVFIPAKTDLHQDHKIVNQASRIALVRYLRSKSILEINEVISPFLNLDPDTKYTIAVSVDPEIKQKMVEQYTTENKPLNINKEYLYKIYDELSVKWH